MKDNKLIGILMSVMFVLLVFVNQTNGQIVQRNSLSQEYEKKGGASCLTVTSWRKAIKDSITLGLVSLPTSVREVIIKVADQSLKEPWPMLKTTDYLSFSVNGNRSEFEELYFSRRKKLNKFLIAELISGKGTYTKEIVNGIGLILDESTWVLPAHLYLQKAGIGLPDPEEAVVDLFAGETSVLLAWAKFLMEKQLNEISPIIVKRIDYELNRRIIKPYLQRNDFWWMGFDDPKRKMNNWNIWINNNILMTTLLAVDDSLLRVKIIDKNVKSADKFVNSYPADGGCDEGPGYWGAAGGKLIDYINLLGQVSQHRLSWKNDQQMHNIVSYIYKAHISDKWFVNFADSPVRLVPDPATVFTGGEIFKDQTLKDFAGYLYLLSGSATTGYGLDDINLFIKNLPLHQKLKGVPAKAPMVKQSWLEDLQVLFTREVEGSNVGLFMAAKAGNNEESHNHNDIGSFIVYVNGLPALIDLGAARYTRQTFSPDRYKLWVYNSNWHNCPTINGVNQGAGGNFLARNVSFKGSARKSTLNMDLASAYPSEAAVNKWLRTIDFDHDKGVINLFETYDLKTFKKGFDLNFISAVPIIRNGDGLLKLILADSKTVLNIKFNPKIFEVLLVEQPNSDPGLKVWGKTIYHISFKSKGTALKGSHNIQFFK